MLTVEAVAVAVALTEVRISCRSRTPMEVLRIPRNQARSNICCHMCEVVPPLLRDCKNANFRTLGYLYAPLDEMRLHVPCTMHRPRRPPAQA